MLFFKVVLLILSQARGAKLSFFYHDKVCYRIEHSLDRRCERVFFAFVNATQSERLNRTLLVFRALDGAAHLSYFHFLHEEA